MQCKIRNSLVKQASAPKSALARAAPLVFAFALALCSGCADTLGSCNGRLSRINLPTPVQAAPRAIVSPTPAGAP